MRVLIVEDEALVALILEDMLLDLGHEIVGPYAMVDESLSSIDRDAIDIAIIDLNLRGISSLPVAAALEAKHIPVIFSSGYGREVLPEKFRNAPLLQKPFQQEDIASVITQSLLERS